MATHMYGIRGLTGKSGDFVPRIDYWEPDTGRPKLRLVRKGDLRRARHS